MPNHLTRALGTLVNHPAFRRDARNILVSLSRLCGQTRVSRREPLRLIYRRMTWMNSRRRVTLRGKDVKCWESPT